MDDQHSDEDKKQPAHVAVMLMCYEGWQQQVAESLREAFEDAAIGDHLIDVVYMPALSGDIRPDRFPPVMQMVSIMLKVLPTAEAAAVLRSESGGYFHPAEPVESGKVNRYWEFDHVTRSAPPPDDPGEGGLKINDRVRILVWPFQGYTGQVVQVNRSIHRSRVHISSGKKVDSIWLYFDQIEKD